MPVEQRLADEYLDDLHDSDPVISKTNCIDLLVLEFALTPDEARDAYDAWTKSA